MRDVRLFLERVFPYLLIVPAVVPVVWAGGVLYPFITPKVLLLRADFLLALGVFLALAFTGRAFYFKRLNNWFAWIPAVLLAIAYLASTLGANFSVSFWSTYVRGDGLLTLSALVFFFYALVLYGDRAFFIKLLKVVAVIGALVASISALQWLVSLSGGTLPFLPPATDRVGGTLGNAAYLAAYLSMSAFATYAIRYELASKVWKGWALAAAWLQVFVVILTATRGSLVALGVAALALLAWRAWKGEKGRERRYAAFALIALIIIAGAFALLRHSLSNSSIEPVARLASIGTNDPDIANRLFIWQHVSSETVSSGHWILGYGGELITIPFDKVYDPTKVTEEWFDRTHDAYLDYFVQFGIMGALLYLALVAGVLYALIRSIRREPLFLPLALMVVAYAVQNIFIFDTSSTLFLLLLAGAAPFMIASAQEKPEPFSAQLPETVALIFPLLALLALWWVVWLPLRANILLTDSYAYQLTDPARSAADLSEGFPLAPYGELEYGYEAYAMYTAQLSSLTGTALATAYQAAFSVVSADYARYPYDARTALDLGQIMALAPSGSAPDPDFERQVLARAIALSPGRDQPWYLLVNLTLAGAGTDTAAQKAAAYQTALGTLAAYELIEPGLAEPHFILAQLYQALGETASSSAEAAKGKAAYTPDLETALRAASYYESVKDWSDAAYFLESAVALSSDDYADEYDLAKVLYLEGDFTASDQIVNELRKDDPSIVPTDANFYAAITTYEHEQQ